MTARDDGGGRMSSAARGSLLSILIPSLMMVACASGDRPSSRAPSVAPLEPHAMRLRPSQDPLVELERWAKLHHVAAGCIVTAVGSLTRVSIRYANREEPTVLEGHFEVTSLVGTLSETGSHLHITVADGEGRSFGGHLLEGSAIYTTLEVVVGQLPGVGFDREVDPTYGYRELVVRPRPGGL